jgi:hypothetical protein
MPWKITPKETRYFKEETLTQLLIVILDENEWEDKYVSMAIFTRIEGETQHYEAVVTISEREWTLITEMSEERRAKFAQEEIQAKEKRTVDVQSAFSKASKATHGDEPIDE